jgi:heme A synthase
MLLLIGLIVMFPAIVAWRRAEKNKTNSTGE